MRSKNKAELSALQAQLRREQLKAQSLEKSLDQKVSSIGEIRLQGFDGKIQNMNHTFFFFSGKGGRRIN